MYQRVSQIVRQWGRFASLALLTVALVSLLSGCGENDECADVSCDFGVCQAGVCENASSCESDMECLPGYVCGAGGACEAATSCQGQGDCDSGSCRGGMCLNPETCESNDDCVDRTYCGDDGTCQPDPCNDVECDSGQCLRGTTQCVSAETCTVETEAQDCLDGDICFEGSCVDEAGFCEALTCERGTCDFEARACANAANCEGDDNNCVEGFFCGDDGQCHENLCNEDDNTCPRGVCVASTGECGNPYVCEAAEECIEGYRCIDSECVEDELACGDEPCPGNQVCDYDAESMTASCIENPEEACTTSIDCQDGRQCAGNTCIEALVCVPDQFEPNENAEEGTDYNVVATGGSLSANVCEGDTDVYAIDLSQYQGLPLRGQMVVTATYNSRSIGLGELEMRVIDSSSGDDGTVVDTDTSGEMGVDGKLEVVSTLNAASSRQYLVEITDAGSVSQAGVNYTLSVDMFEPGALAACDSAVELEADTTISGDTSDSEAYAFGSTCTELHNNSRDDVYFFELDEPSRVNLNVLPVSSENDFAVSVRSSCEYLASEVACENTSTSGGELLREVLDAGTYFVIVQGAATTESGGRYTMSFEVDTGRVCAQSTSYCEDDDTAQICNRDGSSYVQHGCPLGCEPATGTCIQPYGDVCESPIWLSLGDTRTVNWSGLRNDHQMTYSSCMNNSAGTDTLGADAVYAVRLGVNEGLEATLDLGSGQQGALYIVDNCRSIQSSCVAGADNNDGDSEVATYVNTTGAAQTLLIVADSAAGTGGSADLTVAAFSGE